MGIVRARRARGHGKNGRPQAGTAPGDGRTTEAELRRGVCALLRLFHAKGWASGTGGGLCARAGDRLFLAPTGVHKERVRPEHLFREDLSSGGILAPADPSLRPTECAPIFRAILRARNAGAVAHSHGLPAVLAADLSEGGHLRLERLEMLKGIRSCTNDEPHEVPVIENTSRESELAGAVEARLRDPRFARAHCILVRDHGAYLWGTDLDEAKRHAEVYHFLFEAHRARHLAQRGGR